MAIPNDTAGFMCAPLFPPVTRMATMTPSPAERPPVSMAASPALSSRVTSVEREMAALFWIAIMMNVPRNSAKNSLGLMNDLMTPRRDFLEARDICDGDEWRRDSERWPAPVSCGPGVNW